MGSAFEQISFLTYDAIILELMDALNETTDSMFPRHANLE
jgi:6-phospho-3-hexuloisomerase